MVTSKPNLNFTTTASPRCRRRFAVTPSQLIRQHKSQRHGVSIIEVLTSIVIAMIGVVGVMVLIPFAVRQAQTGLDLDDGFSLGQNAAERFEAAGYTNPTAWAGSPGPSDAGGLWTKGDGMGMFVPTYTSPDYAAPYNIYPAGYPRADFGGPVSAVAIAAQPRPFIMDPLGVMENVGIPGLDPFEAARFPFQMFDAGASVGEIAYPIWRAATSNQVGTIGNPWFDLSFPALTVRNSGKPLLPATSPIAFPPGAFNNPITIHQTRNLMKTNDDLVFGLPTPPGAAVDPIDPEGANYPPVQLMEQVAGTDVRRLHNGAVSWAGLVLPIRDSSIPTPMVGAAIPRTRPSGFTMHVMVFKDRDTSNINLPGSLPPRPAGSMTTSIVRSDATPLSHLNQGFANPVTRINLPLTLGGAGDVQKDDWVMLINRGRTNGFYLTRTGAIVADALLDTTGNCAQNSVNSIYLDEFGYERQVAFYRVRGVSGLSIDVEGPGFDFGDNTDTDFTNDKSPTYLVHLKDVVNVYERTFTFEEDSTLIPKN
jgi:hypothetical protein